MSEPPRIASAPLRGPIFARWLSLLVVGDLFFIGFDAIYRVIFRVQLLALEPTFMRVTQDNGVPEVYGYLKCAVIVGLLATVFLRTRAPVFAAFAAVFLLVLADDGLRLHEQLGYGLVTATGETFAFGPVRMQEVGEILAWSGLGLIVVGLLAAGYSRSEVAARRLARPLLLGFLALILFALVFDFAAALAAELRRGRLSACFEIAEDGGEMLVISAICAYAAAIVGATGGFSRALRLWRM